MLKAPDDFVTGAIFFVGVVVPNDCGEVTDEECSEGHLGTMTPVGIGCLCGVRVGFGRGGVELPTRGSDHRR